MKFLCTPRHKITYFKGSTAGDTFLRHGVKHKRQLQVTTLLATTESYVEHLSTATCVSEFNTDRLNITTSEPNL